MPCLKAEEIVPDVRHVNFVALEPGGSYVWGPRRIREYELILAVQGEFELVCHETGETVRHLPGTVLTIMPQELHTYRLLSLNRPAFFSCIHLELRSDIDRDRDVWRTVPEPRRLTVQTGDADLLELFRRTDQENRRGSRYRDIMVSLMVKEIWLRLAEKWASPERAPSSSQLDAMLQYLRDNRLTHPGRNELAARFHLSPQHINLLFRRGIGISPIRFVHRELVREAYRLLLEEQLSVKETAFRLGFGNPFYFSRVFRQEMGFPPGLVLSKV